MNTEPLFDLAMDDLAFWRGMIGQRAQHSRSLAGEFGHEIFVQDAIGMRDCINRYLAAEARAIGWASR